MRRSDGAQPARALFFAATAQVGSAMLGDHDPGIARRNRTRKAGNET
jgi:hypothetical protein